MKEHEINMAIRNQSLVELDEPILVPFHLPFGELSLLPHLPVNFEKSELNINIIFVF